MLLLLIHKIIWDNPTMAHLFIHHEEDIFLLLKYFHYTFHQKEDTTSKCFSFLFSQDNNHHLIFPAAGICCPFFSGNTTEWQEKAVQAVLLIMSYQTPTSVFSF